MPRIWLITGCSSGFGRQLAITAAENKDIVVATSRDPSKLADLASLGVIAKTLNVQANDAEVQAVIDDILSTVGPIDILVNNAGYILEGAVEECRYLQFHLQGLYESPILTIDPANKKSSINLTSTSSRRSAFCEQLSHPCALANPA
jgi:NAD(P)-dependent dehydrogenase (short-subunit alcohol dehydrogenase family)